VSQIAAIETSRCVINFLLDEDVKRELYKLLHEPDYRIKLDRSKAAQFALDEVFAKMPQVLQIIKTNDIPLVMGSFLASQIFSKGLEGIVEDVKRKKLPEDRLIRISRKDPFGTSITLAEI
jgi:hypothetical protein